MKMIDSYKTTSKLRKKSVKLYTSMTDKILFRKMSYCSLMYYVLFERYIFIICFISVSEWIILADIITVRIFFSFELKLFIMNLFIYISDKL